MSWRTSRITQELKLHDSDLFCKEVNGCLQIWRKISRWISADIYSGDSFPAQFIFSLTHDWSLSGTPVEWGMEPIMKRVKEMDSWSKQDLLDSMRKKRDRIKDQKEQSIRNDFRARAADLRKDFARATNDINTSTLEKVDSRRNKDGYY